MRLDDFRIWCRDNEIPSNTEIVLAPAGLPYQEIELDQLDYEKPEGVTFGTITITFPVE